MRPMLIVVIDILVHDLLQVPFVEDQHVIKAFPSQGADPSFGNGIGLGCELKGSE